MLGTRHLRALRCEMFRDEELIGAAYPRRQHDVWLEAAPLDCEIDTTDTLGVSKIACPFVFGIFLLIAQFISNLNVLIGLLLRLAQLCPLLSHQSGCVNHWNSFRDINKRLFCEQIVCLNWPVRFDGFYDFFDVEFSIISVRIVIETFLAIFPNEKALLE